MTLVDPHLLMHVKLQRVGASILLSLAPSLVHLDVKGRVCADVSPVHIKIHKFCGETLENKRALTFSAMLKFQVL